MLRDQGIFIFVGTSKGGFVFQGSSSRKTWKMRGPFFEGNDVTDIVSEEGNSKPAVYAAVNTPIWGSYIYKSVDVGKTWKKTKSQPRFPKSNPYGLSVKRIWNIQVDEEGRLFAGVDPAALFLSENGGNSWKGIDALNFHETRKNWQPGGGGLCLHTIVIHSKDSRKIRVGISAVGVVGSDDDGESWRFLNKNIIAKYSPNKYPEYGQCVHKIDYHPSKPDTLYLQNHGGVYVSHDFGKKWSDIGKGLPSDFGFPIVVHRREPDTVYVVPIDERPRYPPKGEFQMWMSSDGGGRWRKSTKGLPSSAYFNVLRDAMDVDIEETEGIYIGTTSGQVFYSRDDGKSWQKMADSLPRINSVTCIST